MCRLVADIDRDTSASGKGPPFTLVLSLPRHGKGGATCREPLRYPHLPRRYRRKKATRMRSACLLPHHRAAGFVGGGVELWFQPLFLQR